MPALPLIIGHRGSSRLAPENTLAAFRLAFAEGADGIEADFRLTGDGEIVCIHDATTRRTAGTRLTVARATLSQLRALDVGAWKGEQWRGERIPTLAEVLAILPPGKRLFIELKSGPEILAPLVAVLSAPGCDPSRVGLLAFDAALLAEAGRVLPQYRRFWNTAYRMGLHGWRPSLAEVMTTLEETGAAGLSSRSHRVIDTAFVHALRVAGKELHVWTVDSPRTAALFVTLGVDSIMTNRPGWLRDELARRA